MKRAEPKFIELDDAKLHEILRIIEPLVPADIFVIIKAVFECYRYFFDLVGRKNATIRRLRNLLFGARTEKTDAVLGKDTDSAAAPASSESDDSSASADSSGSRKDRPPRRKGHGRNGANAYRNAHKIPVPHPSLKAGDPCPECHDGTVYEMTRPGVVVRFVGQPPLHAKVYQLEKLRCNLCGKVFTAPLPEEAGSQKYDATAGSMIALLKYGTGCPFHRLNRLQDSLGIPLPDSTQWDVVYAKAQRIAPAYRELIRQAAQGDVLHNDDTTVKILEFMGKRAPQAAMNEDTPEGSAEAKGSQRTGLFTSGIVSTREGLRIALFFSGRQHAGENLRDVLAERAAELEPPIQMCDPLSRNMPAELGTILANCLAHGRRQFTDVAELFPGPCEHVLQALKVVYQNDATARQQQMSPEARLRFHQTHSGPIMEELHGWLNRQIDERLVEPNSGLGQAITYLLKHWQKMTLFLRKAGAPLDNNICERALKKAILHRKNAYFYKTQNGARVGDLYMSLIYTCELEGANPFDYLTELELHADELAARPEDWMPWNYRQTLEGSSGTSASTTPESPSPAGPTAEAPVRPP
jgi:transposase